MSGYPLLFLQIFAVLLVATALALFSNSTREDGLPLIVPFPPEYRCRSAAGAAVPIETTAALRLFGRAGTLFVDSRTREEFAQGHIEGAVNVPHLFVEPLPASAVSSLRGHDRVVVYCNTEEAEVSRLMAAELSEAGIKGVFYLLGGLRGWAEAGGRVAGQAPKRYEAPR